MQKPKILIVDDNANFRQVLSTAFTTRDYEVVQVENGQEALDEYQKDGFSGIVLDMKMPVMDGIQFLETIHSGEGIHCPIIVTSTASYTKQAVLESGASVFMDKVEYTPSQIVDQVELLIQQSQSR